METGYAFELAGATSEFVHLNEIVREPARLGEFQILAIPGGFSYGDDIAAGRIFANQLVHHLRDRLAEFIAAGKPVIGICNGFQVLVKTDFLPGPLAGRTGQLATLTNNASGRFIDRWIRVATRSTKCIWTAGLGAIELPVAHGEGRFVSADEDVRRALWDNDQVALIYARSDGAAADGAFPDNPNGSVDDIAGICHATGLVFGLMPHPERHVSVLQHPAWTSRNDKLSKGQGLRIFQNAVAHVRDAVGAGV
jgi:phosphoribosylformylglycinamidine synthase